MLHITGEHSMQEYMRLLNTSQTLFVDDERLQRAASECMYRARDLEYLCLQELRKECGGRYSTMTKNNLIEYLEEQGVDFDKRFCTKKGGEPSLDLKRTITPLIEQGVAVAVLTIYKEWRSYLTYASFLRKMIERRSPFHVNEQGRVILEFSTHLEEQENLRVYYKDLAVVSIPKPFSNIVTTSSSDQHIAWCDYPQADWRFAYNLFVRDSTNEDIMRDCVDAYEGLARIVEGDRFDEDAFKSTRKAYKVDCLSVFYNSSNNKAIPKAMREYFQSRERYARYLYDLSLLYRFKLPVPITSYFGYEQLLPEAPYESAFISKGLNTPIQTFTSHVVNETVMGLLERFWELGYTKDDINIYYVRHDEPIFVFRDTILKDAWIFKDCSEIHIDGFTPIHLDFHFGDYYKQEDEKLTQRVAEMMNSSDDRLHYYPAGEMKPYNPVPSVESVYMVPHKVGEEPGYEYRFYNQRTSEQYRYRCPIEDMEEGAASVIREKLAPALKYPRYLLVMNNDFEWMDALGPNDETLLKVIRKQDSNAMVILRGEEQ